VQAGLLAIDWQAAEFILSTTFSGGFAPGTSAVHEYANSFASHPATPVVREQSYVVFCWAQGLEPEATHVGGRATQVHPEPAGVASQ
jgi:hypothetical protein